MPAQLVADVGDAPRGRDVQKEDAAREAVRLGDPRNIPAGYQQGYFGQDLLVVLTALRRPHARKERRSWVYTL